MPVDHPSTVLAFDLGATSGRAMLGDEFTGADSNSIFGGLGGVQSGMTIIELIGWERLGNKRYLDLL